MDEACGSAPMVLKSGQDHGEPTEKVSKALCGLPQAIWAQEAIVLKTKRLWLCYLDARTRGQHFRVEKGLSFALETLLTAKIN